MENTKRWHHHDGIFWGNHLFELLEFFEQFRNNQINHHKTLHPKVFAEKFGSMEKSFYLCSVRMKVLAIRAESREGKTISTLPI